MNEFKKPFFVHVEKLSLSSLGIGDFREKKKNQCLLFIACVLLNNDCFDNLRQKRRILVKKINASFDFE